MNYASLGFLGILNTSQSIYKEHSALGALTRVHDGKGLPPLVR